MIPFLDVSIVRLNDNSLKCSVYRKPTANDRYLDFRSNNPVIHKTNTMKTLLKRAFTICSNEEEKEIEIKTVTQHLMNNGYPKKLIKNQIRQLT